MARSLPRAKRISAVLGLLEGIGRRDLMEKTRIADDAKRVHDEVLASLVADEFLSGPFVDLIAKRLPRLAAQVEVHNQGRAAALELWQTRQMRAVASAKLVEDALASKNRENEARDLQQLLEILYNSGPQGSGKSTKRD